MYAHQNEEPPRRCDSKGVPFLVLTALAASVKPLADVVCDHTYCDGYQK